MKRKKHILIILIVMGLILSLGCSKEGQEEKTALTTVKIGVLPVEDTMPFIIGMEKGYFAQEKIKVELVPFQSAMEKESALQSGQLDGVITDLLVAALLKDSGLDIKITSLTSGVTPREGRFAIVTAPGKKITNLADLKGKKIGVSQNTIIEYVTDGILQEGGLAPQEVEKVLIPKLPVRLEMLLNGKIDAATFPDPLAAYAEAKGAVAFGDDTAQANLSQVVLVMDGDFIGEKEDVLKGFFAAYKKAVEEYNDDPEKYRDLLVKQARVPEEIQKDYSLPLFPAPSLPQEKEIADVIAWLQEKGVIKNNLSYGELVEEGLY